MTKQYYVLILHGTQHMVLMLEPYTLTGAKQAIAWQAVGGEPRANMSICRYVPAHAGFVDIETGDILKPGRSPYTEKAWADFKASLPKREEA